MFPMTYFETTKKTQKTHCLRYKISSESHRPPERCSNGKLPSISLPTGWGTEVRCWLSLFQGDVSALKLLLGLGAVSRAGLSVGRVVGSCCVLPAEQRPQDCWSCSGIPRSIKGQGGRQMAALAGGRGRAACVRLQKRRV